MRPVLELQAPAGPLPPQPELCSQPWGGDLPQEPSAGCTVLPSPGPGAPMEGDIVLEVAEEEPPVEIEATPRALLLVRALLPPLAAASFAVTIIGAADLSVLAAAAVAIVASLAMRLPRRWVISRFQDSGVCKHSLIKCGIASVLLCNLYLLTFVAAVAGPSSESQTGLVVALLLIGADWTLVLLLPLYCNKKGSQDPSPTDPWANCG